MINSSGRTIRSLGKTNMKKPLFGGKAAQIRGIRKALKNHRTPRQLIPSLKKRLAKLTACILFALFSSSARAQAPVSLVPTQQTLATNVACTGSAQNFVVNNRNQSQHWASIQMSGANTSSEMQIFGLDSSGNVFPISGAAFAAGLPVVVTGTGYYPTVEVRVTCTGGTFVLSYSAGSAPFAVNDGAYLQSQIDKQIFFGASGSASAGGQAFVPPFGSSLGTVAFDFRSSAVAGSTIQIACFGGATGAAAYETWTWTLANATGLQVIRVPGASCDNLSLTYSTIASGGLIDADYFFDAPGSPNSLTNYTHITGTTAVVVKAGPGTVHSVVVGTPAAGTISLFDLVPASCTGTPSTNTVSVITATATFPSAPEIYDVIFQNGICVKASAAMDITVSSQ